MTKITMLFAFLITILCASAQLDKGTWLGGGNGSFYTYTEKFDDPVSDPDAKYTNINISLNAGYFIMDKLAIGLNPAYYFYKGKQIGVTIYYEKPTNFTIGPFVRYYLLNKEKQFNMLIDSRYTIGFLNSKRGASYKGNLYTFSIAAGPEVFFNSSVGLEFLMGYTFLKEKFHGSYNRIRTNSGFRIAAGIQMHLQNL